MLNRQRTSMAPKAPAKQRPTQRPMKSRTPMPAPSGKAMGRPSARKMAFNKGGMATKTHTASGKVLTADFGTNGTSYSDEKRTARTPQGAGRAIKAAIDQGRVRSRMILDAAAKAEKLRQSEGASTSYRDVYKGRISSMKEDLAAKQNYNASLRRKPANRPNAKKAK